MVKTILACGCMNIISNCKLKRISIRSPYSMCCVGVILLQEKLFHTQLTFYGKNQALSDLGLSPSYTRQDNFSFNLQCSSDIS